MPLLLATWARCRTAASSIGSLVPHRAAGSDAAPLVARSGAATNVSSLETDRIGFAVALHTAALPHGFFVELGSRFMRRYYRTFVESPHAVALVATLDGQPVGVLVGMLRARAHARWVLRSRGAGLGAEAVLAFARRPTVALRFVRSRLARYLGMVCRHTRPTAGQVSPGTADVAVLSHVAVVDGARMMGCGAALVAAFEECARSAGAETAFLTTLDGDGGAGDFYRSLGWRPGDVRMTADGLGMREWSRKITEVDG